MCLFKGIRLRDVVFMMCVGLWIERIGRMWLRVLGGRMCGILKVVKGRMVTF